MSDTGGAKPDDLRGRLAELEALRTRLVEIDALVTAGRLAVSVAHEIRGPLQAVLTHLEIVGRALPRGFGERGSWDLALSGLERIGEIVEDLLGAHRPPAPMPGRIDCNALARAAAGFVGSRARSSGVSVTLDLDDDPPIVRGSYGRLFQVILNLLLNAVEAMPHGGSLRVAVSAAPGDSLRMIVEDTGIGIHADVLASIFEPFFSTKDAQGGVGLGLAVVHGIVERHGGTIAVASEIGQGTRFTITLPRKPARPRDGEGAGDDPSLLCDTTGSGRTP